VNLARIWAKLSWRCGSLETQRVELARRRTRPVGPVVRAALLARAYIVDGGGVGRGKDRHCSSRVIIGTLEQLGTFATGPEQGE